MRGSLLLLLTSLVLLVGCKAEPPAEEVAARPADPPRAPAKTRRHKDLYIANRCEQKVTVFVGDKPGFSAGRYLDINAGTTTAYPLKKGDAVWIVDADRKGVAEAKVGASTRELEIAAGCETWKVIGSSKARRRRRG